MGIFNLGFIGLTDILFVILFILLAVLFLSDFKMTKRKSWLSLLALTAFGGLLVSRIWRRKAFLNQLREREQKIKELEGRYEALKEEAKITEAQYDQAVANLENTLKQNALAVIRADEELAERTEEIEREYQDISSEDLINNIHNLIQ